MKRKNYVEITVKVMVLQQRRNFRKRDAFVACYIIFLYVMVGVGFYQASPRVEEN